MPKKFSVIEKFNQSVEVVKGDAEWTHEGLCDFFCDRDVPVKVRKTFDLFVPIREDSIQLANEHKSIMYWGSDSVYNCTYKLTGLRLTILFFIATIHNEY